MDTKIKQFIDEARSPYNSMKLRDYEICLQMLEILSGVLLKYPKPLGTIPPVVKEDYGITQWQSRQDLYMHYQEVLQQCERIIGEKT